jgi:hypothetical protein
MNYDERMHYIKEELDKVSATNGYKLSMSLLGNKIHQVVVKEEIQEILEYIELTNITFAMNLMLRSLSYTDDIRLAVKEMKEIVNEKLEELHEKYDLMKEN